MWLVKEADRRIHGTLKERVADRFTKESEALAPLASVRFDTSYVEHRHVAWDGYVDVRGNRYSVPDEYCGKQVIVRVALDGQIRIHDLNGDAIADHLQKPVQQGWSTVPAYHGKLWQQVLNVQRRDLSVYEAVAEWN